MDLGLGRRAIASCCASRSVVRGCSKSQPALFRFASTPIFSDFSDFTKFSAIRRSVDMFSAACPTTDGVDVAQAASALDAPMSLVRGLVNVMLHAGEPRPLAVLGRVDTRNLTQRRKGRKDAIIALFYSRFSPRHSRESGNPEGCSQARHLKSSANSSQRIPSPFMGLRGGFEFRLSCECRSGGGRGVANQDNHPKSSANSSHRIPSPFMGLQG